LNVGYLAPNANDPTSNADDLPGPNNAVGNTNGFFGGAFAALAQVDVQPTKNLALGLTYVRSFGLDPFGNTGSSGLFSAANPTRVTFANTTSDAVGFQFTYRPIKQLNVAGWVGYANVDTVQNAADYILRADSADVLNWAITFAVPDLLNKRDLLGLVFGQPPQVISLSGLFDANGPLPPNLPPNSLTRFNSYHLEGFYRFAVNRNISITPGVIAIFNPNSNSTNDPIVVGAVRTTFSF
ncbi:iron uptake porin, partial [Thermosynechococcus sp. M55_K2018_012]|uniref:iron uptake porin n=1 Tax=Thermosynechococcus sp. M55_K2018_012 TaxID=2747809 RepID=UPI0019E17487